MMRVFTRGVSEIPEWIEKLGGVIQPSEADPIKYVFPYVAPTTSYPDFIGSDGIGGRWAVKAEKDEGGGAALWRVLQRNVLSRGIKVLYHARANRLVKSGERIVGVTALTPDGEVSIKTNRAVVLTC